MASTTNRVVWWSLVVSLLVYAVVAHVGTTAEKSSGMSNPATVPREMAREQ